MRKKKKKRKQRRAWCSRLMRETQMRIQDHKATR
jgi:hypothetical protein